MLREELIGQSVINKGYGKGTIKDFDGERIEVEFTSKTTKFQFPKSFSDGFVKAEDEKLQEVIMVAAEELKEKEQKEKEQKRIQAEEKKNTSNDNTRGSHKDTLYRGETFRTHAEALNECFGFNYKHFQKAYKHIDDKYAVWFPSIAKRVMGEYLAADTGNGWLNILCENDTVIYEKNVENVSLNTEREDNSYRFVFAKFDGDDSYKFLGLYSADPIPTEQGFKYQRIGIQINLNTMEIIK